MDRISMITALFARALAIKSIGGDSLSYIGVTTTVLSDGATTNPITIDGDTVTATNGNVALYSGDAFVFNGTIWQASSAISQIFTEIGDLSDLDTEAKTDLVSAINEVNEEKQDDVELSLTPTAVVSDRDIQDGQGNTLSVLAEALTKTASGNPVVITDCAGGKARSLITEINAIQDLHGYDHPWAGGAGKNLFPAGVSPDTIPANVHVDILSNGYKLTALRADNYINVVFIIGDAALYAGKTLTLKCNDWAYTGSTHESRTRLSYLPTSGSTVASDSVVGQSCSINVPSDANGVIRAQVYLSFETACQIGDTTSFYDIQLEVGSTATAYEPYSNICPISGRTAVALTRSDGDEISEDFTIQLGTTVYGAEINWDTGVGTVKTAKDDMGGLTWSYSSDGNGYFYTVISDMQYASPDSITSCYKNNTEKGAASSVLNNGDFNTVIYRNYMYVRDDRYTDATAFKTAVTGQTVCYKLATPTTIQLTPEQLEMLKGYNRVTIESGTITLDYIAKAISGNDEEIAPLVGDKATKAYSVNDFIERNDGLYRVTAPIASGASFTANNTVKMSIGEALTYLYNK